MAHPRDLHVGGVGAGRRAAPPGEGDRAGAGTGAIATAELKSWRVTVTEDGSKLSVTWTGFKDADEARDYLDELMVSRRMTRPKGQKAIEEVTDK